MGSSVPYPNWSDPDLLASEVVSSSPEASQPTIKSTHSVPVVCVIDSSATVRDDLKELFESVGLRVELFASAAPFLESSNLDTVSCLVLDVRLHGTNGVDLQNELAKAEIHVPVVFITAYGDVPMAVRAMKAGAVDFLTKPFRNQDLLDAVFTALRRDLARRAEEETVSTAWQRFESLSVREREVLARVASGLLNKQIAAELGLSEVMVKVHRSHGMRKINAKSVAELVRLTDLLQSKVLPKAGHGHVTHAATSRSR